MHLRSAMLFLVTAMIFAAVHFIAIELSLYWYYWWFDIVMHFWGGLMLGFGVHVLTPLSPVPIRPTTGVVLLVLLAATVTWEVFEWAVGLWDPSSYLFDTSKDMLIGFAGGLLAHAILMRRYNRDT